MTKIIDGKALAAKIRQELAEEIGALSTRYESKPGLAVIQVGADPASSIYVRNKKRACEEAGIVSFGYDLPAEVSQSELLELIETLNNDERVNGILCQLPVPDHIDEFTILSAIDPAKDVDGFHPVNVGLLSIGHDCLVSCTPAGVLEMMHAYDLPIEGQRCVVIGRSNIVGKPVAQLMLKEHATVTIAHSRTKNLPALCREADILIAAIGRAGFVTTDFVKPGATVSDVGINRYEEGKVVGDVAFDEVSKVAGAITPVPGGVGPMTIAMLLKNTVKAWRKANGIIE
jgi:methylenetetrahydrofolate dehydrogenase (NADP+)/methenyltetrahydrofolate cyclohydrolase